MYLNIKNVYAKRSTTNNYKTVNSSRYILIVRPLLIFEGRFKEFNWKCSPETYLFDTLTHSSRYNSHTNVSSNMTINCIAVIY